jgi:hypothetical protein
LKDFPNKGKYARKKNVNFAGKRQVEEAKRCEVERLQA